MARLFIENIYKNIYLQRKSFSSRAKLTQQCYQTNDSNEDNLYLTGSQKSCVQSHRYNVCQEREIGKKFVFHKPPIVLEVQREPHNKVEPLEIASGIPPVPYQHEGYRSFNVSKTQKNITLPMKWSKLAKPFPDPIR